MSEFRLPLDGQIPRLMRYATALTRDVDQATDLVEDTLREAIAQKLDGRCGKEIRVWLLTILHELRDNPFRLVTPSSGGTVADPNASPELSRFDAAIGRLPEEQRAPMLLIGLEGMTYDETARILGIPVGTMRSRLLRGKETLARAMAPAAPTRQPAKARRAA